MSNQETGTDWQSVEASPAFEPGVVHLWRCFLDGPVGEARSSLSADELQRADRFSSDEGRERFTLRRAFLRRILSLYCQSSPIDNVSNVPISFSYGSVGKPSLRNSAHPLEFNQSDSGRWTVVAVTPGVQVGVDIEEVRARTDIEVISREVFTERERRELAAASEKERRLAFFNGWTRKEAAIKADGGGLAYPLRDIEVSLDPHAPARLYRFGNAPLQDWSILTFEVTNDVIGAVVVAEPDAGLRRLSLAPQEGWR